MSDLGVTFDQYGEKQPDHIIPFDAFPRVLEASEWDSLMRGLIQRVAVWNAFFATSTIPRRCSRPGSFHLK